MNSRTMVCALISLVVTSVALVITQSALAAQIGLSVTQSSTVVIKSGLVDINATVTNTDDSPQSGNLSFSMNYQDWSSGLTIGQNGAGAGVLPPGNNQSFPFQGDTNTATLGSNAYSVTVNSNVATNSPQTYNGSVFVLAHSIPEIYSYVKSKFVYVPPAEPAAAEPTADPLAFGATGGGESFAAASPAVFGNADPPEPTAGMALNWIYSVGDPEITSDFSTFGNLAAIPADDENPADGIAFHVQCDATHQGTFSKLFSLGFSDEQDLPGADAPGSFVADLLYTFHIHADGSSTYEIDVVPEPASVVLLASGMTVACGMTRFKRNRLPRQS